MLLYTVLTCLLEVSSFYTCYCQFAQNLVLLVSFDKIYVSNIEMYVIFLFG